MLPLARAAVGGTCSSLDDRQMARKQEMPPPTPLSDLKGQQGGNDAGSRVSQSEQMSLPEAEGEVMPVEGRVADLSAILRPPGQINQSVNKYFML